MAHNVWRITEVGRWYNIRSANAEQPLVNLDERLLLSSSSVSTTSKSRESGIRLLYAVKS